LILADVPGGSTYSQFREDPILTRIFEVIGVEHQTCCEAGAFDGLDCSNTALWWKDRGWSADLIEGDPERYDALHATMEAAGGVRIGGHGIDPNGRVSFPDGEVWRRPERAMADSTWRVPISASNVDDLLFEQLDLFSLDIDGDEIFVLQAMTARPRVLVVEFNQSVPWWMDVHPVNPGGCFGSSASAIVRTVSGRDGYRLVEVTGCNLIFVHETCSDFLHDLTGSRNARTILRDWDERERPLTYLATDYSGRPCLLGGPPPWGLVEERCTEALCETDHVIPTDRD
jgi:hypothetical protein